MVLADYNRAGCPVTRRSTLCTVLRRGTHLLSLTSTTQGPVALSSGEAEFYAATKAGSRLVGFEQMLRDLGIHGDDGPPVLETDSASAKTR